MKRKWTEKEINYLKANYGMCSPRRCSKHLQRTKHSVKQKAIRLGLGRERRSFTEYEIDYIKSYYSEKGPIALAKELKVNKSSICTAANWYGLKMTSKARGKISTKANTGRKMSEKTKQTMANANRKYSEPNRCIDCGKDIKRRATRCRTCAAKFHRSGDKNPWWKGGVSSLYQMIAHALYPVWKYPILCRDNFTCQVCGNHDHLEVHHLRLFTEIRDLTMRDYPQLSLDNYEDKVKLVKLIVLEHEMEDGVTLCRKCHEDCHFNARGELTGNSSEEDNPQPSPKSNFREGSTTNLRVLPGGAGDSNKDTSALIACA